MEWVAARLNQTSNLKPETSSWRVMPQKITSRTNGRAVYRFFELFVYKYSESKTRCGPTQKGELPLRAHQALSREKMWFALYLASALPSFGDANWARNISLSYRSDSYSWLLDPIPCLNTQSFLVWKFRLAASREVQQKDRDLL